MLNTAKLLMLGLLAGLLIANLLRSEIPPSAHAALVGGSWGIACTSQLCLISDGRVAYGTISGAVWWKQDLSAITARTLQEAASLSDQKSSRQSLRDVPFTVQKQGADDWKTVVPRAKSP